PGYALSFCRRSGRKIFEACGEAGAERLFGLADLGAESRIVLDSILDPVLLGGESDQNPRRLAVPRDHDLFAFRQAQIPGEIVLDVGQRHLLQPGTPELSSHSCAYSFEM